MGLGIADDRVGTGVEQSHRAIDERAGRQARIVVEAERLQRVGEIERQGTGASRDIPHSQRVVERAGEQDVLGERVELGDVDLANMTDEIGLGSAIVLAAVDQVLRHAVHLFNNKVSE